MSNHEHASPPAPITPPPRRTWDFTETTLVGVIAYGVYTLTSWFALTALTDPHATTTSAFVLGVVYIAASSLAIAVLWIAIKMARRDFAEYLALNRPSSDELLRAVATTAVVLFAESVALYVSGMGAISSDLYVNAEHTGAFLIFLIGGCIAVPVMEELLFRGFMFRGWSESYLQPVGSIVLTSILWGGMHTQYDWFGRFWIFALGLALGYFRWRSNSTWLTVIVHSAVNAFIFVAMGL
jgi:uncharacterized protein